MLSVYYIIWDVIALAKILILKQITTLHCINRVLLQCYCSACVQEITSPKRSYSSKTDISLTTEIHRRIAMLSQQASTTINGYIRQTLAKAVDVTL